MTIRPAAAQDAPAVAECLRAAFEPYRTDYTAAAYADTVPGAAGVAARMQSMTVLVAVEGDQVVGTLGYAQVEGRQQGHLRGMALLPSAQGRGIADALLAAAEAALQRVGCIRVTLHTTAPLRHAVRFYGRNGFARTGATADYFGMPLVEWAKPLGSGER